MIELTTAGRDMGEKNGRPPPCSPLESISPRGAIIRTPLCGISALLIPATVMACLETREFTLGDVDIWDCGEYTLHCLLQHRKHNIVLPRIEVSQPRDQVAVFIK